MPARAGHAMPRDARGRTLPRPYLLFLGDITVEAYAKTAAGLRDWAREACVGEYRLPGCKVSTGLPELDPAQARARGARSLVIGVATPGGAIPAHWLPALLGTMEAGLDLVGGMHSRLADVEELRVAAQRLGRGLHDVRVPPAGIPVASGRRRTGRRLLTVGTDCAVGKKYTALALARAFRGRGIDADFRASGQTGILISGTGMPMDAVAADFCAGAAELLSPDADAAHWDVIEGQGSLLHPAYAGVSLALLHGSQPDVFVVCHQPGRGHMLGFPGHAVPAIEEIIELTRALGRRTNPGIRCAGVSLNTRGMDAEAARRACEAVAARLGLPAADPMRGGPAFEALVEACLA
jgi:uncharacterized NAD-dependent epimerase/dehydratase family protein